MLNMLKYISLTLSLCFAIAIATPCLAQAPARHSLNNFDFKIKAGANIGGTAPMGIPAQIREIKSFNPLISLNIGIGAAYWFAPQWGVAMGVHFENKSMKAIAGVKEYAMRFGEFEGLFTGEVQTNVKNGYMTLPVTLCFNFLPPLTAHFGLYYAYLLTPSFYGSVYDGYLRQGVPGSETNTNIPKEEPQTYAFPEELSLHDFGLTGGVEWNVMRHFLLSFNLSWGLRPLFPKSFAGIQISMYNIYGTFAFGYLF
jgi:hypothetical protein